MKSNIHFIVFLRPCSGMWVESITEQLNKTGPRNKPQFQGQVVQIK